MIQNSELMKGIAPAVILKLLSQRSMYGYEIIRLVNEKTNGEFQWKEGALYPCLHFTSSLHRADNSHLPTLP